MTSIINPFLDQPFNYKPANLSNEYYRLPPHPNPPSNPYCIQAPQLAVTPIPTGGLESLVPGTLPTPLVGPLPPLPGPAFPRPCMPAW